MRNHRIATIAALAAISCLAAAPLAARSDLPHRYNPASRDGLPVVVANPADGLTWSVWAYRNNAEYDIAIAYQDATGLWSEPVFIGGSDRRDQIQPDLTVDARGNLYLAWTERSTGAVMRAALRAGTERWTSAFAVTQPGERGFMPALRVVGDRLVIAFRSGQALVLRDVELLPAVQTGHGVQDGPDPFDSRSSGGDRKGTTGSSEGAWDDGGASDDGADGSTGRDRDNSSDLAPIASGSRPRTN